MHDYLAGLVEHYLKIEKSIKVIIKIFKKLQDLWSLLAKIHCLIKQKTMSEVRMKPIYFTLPKKIKM